MDLFEVVQTRRSIRNFKAEKFPDSNIGKAIEAAILAPNSSNLQVWDFYWVQSEDARRELIQHCVNQSAARTASDLMVVVADPDRWKRAQPPMLAHLKATNAPGAVHQYYEKSIPAAYTWGLMDSLVPLKRIAAFASGLFKPMVRGPFGLRDLQEVAMKSAALAAENFVLAITAQGGATCMMEGFDERRIKRMLKLPYSARVAMVISVGYEADKNPPGPRFRLPIESVLHRI